MTGEADNTGPNVQELKYRLPHLSRDLALDVFGDTRPTIRVLPHRAGADREGVKGTRLKGSDSDASEAGGTESECSCETG